VISCAATGFAFLLDDGFEHVGGIVDRRCVFESPLQHEYARSVRQYTRPFRKQVTPLRCVGEDAGQIAAGVDRDAFLDAGVEPERAACIAGIKCGGKVID
jgi:hypothetical protein